jgi:signal transduction histidine kinase
MARSAAIEPGFREKRCVAMYKKLAANDTSQGDAPGLLSHDLKNDLAIIMGCCDLLGDVEIEDPQVARHLEMIREAARHMKDRILKTSCGVPTLPRSHTA